MLRTCLLLGLVPAFAAAQSFDYVHGGTYERVTLDSKDEAWVSLTGGVLRHATYDPLTDTVSWSNAVLPNATRGDLRGVHTDIDGSGWYGYCVGDDGTLLFADDPNQPWILKPQVLNHNGDSVLLFDVWFEDRLTGFVIGFHNTVLKTIDGGMTWDDIRPLGHIDLEDPEWYRIHAFGPDDLFMTADNGWYATYTGGGNSVANQIDLDNLCYLPQAAPNPGGGYNFEIWDVGFDGDDGLLVGGVVHNDGYIFRTSNRGATWDIDTTCFDRLPDPVTGIPPTDRLPTLYSMDIQGSLDQAVAVGYGSTTLLRGFSDDASPVGACDPCGPGSLAWEEYLSDTDQNTTFEPLDDGGRPFLRDVMSSRDLLSLWTVGDFGTMRRSEDLGVTWNEYHGNHRGRTEAAEFIDAQTGFTFGQRLSIFRTFDGGATFERSPNDPQSNAYFEDGALVPGSANGDVVAVSSSGWVGYWSLNGAWSETEIAGEPLNCVESYDYPGVGPVVLIGGDGGQVWAGLYGSTSAQLVNLSLIYGGAPVAADVVDIDWYGGFVVYLCSDSNVYLATEIDPTKALIQAPIAGSGTPTTLAVRDFTDMLVGDDAGDLFQLAGAQFVQVPSLPANLVEVLDVEPAGANHWWATGRNGVVVQYDGSTWTAPKSSVGATEDVVGAEFFGESAGLLFGRKHTVTSW